MVSGKKSLQECQCYKKFLSFNTKNINGIICGLINFQAEVWHGNVHRNRSQLQGCETERRSNSPGPDQISQTDREENHESKLLLFMY